MTVTIYESRETLSWFDGSTGEVTTVAGPQEAVREVWHDAGEPQIIARFLPSPTSTKETWK